MPENTLPNQPTEPDVDQVADPEPPPTSARDQWWWSPSLAIVAGLCVAGFQVSAIRTGGIWLNWVMVALGIGLAASGLVRLLRAYPRR